MSDIDFDKRLKQFIVWTLRKASYRWAPRYKALKNAQVGKDAYTCKECEKVFTRKGVQVDHIKPVVDPVLGFVTWDIYISRLFCSSEGYQILCKPCHKEKTGKEREVRREQRKTKSIRRKP
jgi:5-methylcytosine-specific restriction endonuclease McrA